MKPICLSTNRARKHQILILYIFVSLCHTPTTHKRIISYINMPLLSKKILSDACVWRMRRSPAYIETPQIRLPSAVNISYQNIRGFHSEHTQNFIYTSLKCKWPIHTKLLAPNDLISLSYRTQYCVWNDIVYYELKKKIRLKYLSATWPVLEDFLGFLKVSLSRHNKLGILSFVRSYVVLRIYKFQPDMTQMKPEYTFQANTINKKRANAVVLSVCILLVRL